jgi:hypothetical protein
MAKMMKAMGESEDASNFRSRALRWAALGVVSTLVLAIACIFEAGVFRLAALFAVPVAGAFGTTWADLRFTHEQYAAFEAEAHRLRAWSTALTHLSAGLVAVSAITTIWCAWQTRATLKSWHWLSFFGLACLVLLVILGDSIGTSEPGTLGLMALDALAAACAMFDVARRRYGAPGRVVAWATWVLSVGLGVFLWVEALGPNGVVGRWFLYH